MKKLVSFVIVFLIAINLSLSQIINVSIAVDGLTCSACSFATQKALLQLDFVDSVQMDLNTNIASITFKPHKKVSIEMLAQKVMDAGFSVGSLIAILNFKEINISNDYCLTYQGDIYHFIETKDKKVDGTVKVKFVGDHYMRKKDFKHWINLANGACKSPDNSTTTGKIYYVTPA